MINRVLNGAVVVTVLVALTQTVGALPVPPGPPNAPDASATVTLMGMACAGFAVLRKFRR